MLRAMLPFVLAEWRVWEQTGQRPTTDPLPPAEILSDPAHLSGPQDLIVVQEPNSDDVLELARQAEASDLGGGTLEVIDRTVDRFCRDYPTAAPSGLFQRVEQRLRSSSSYSTWSHSRPASSPARRGWLARDAARMLAVRPR